MKIIGVRGKYKLEIKVENRVKDKHKNKINRKYIQEKAEVKFYVKETK